MSYQKIERSCLFITSNAFCLESMKGNAVAVNSSDTHKALRFLETVCIQAEHYVAEMMASDFFCRWSMALSFDVSE